MGLDEHDYEAPSGWLEDADDVLQDCLDTFSARAWYQSEGGQPVEIPSGGIFRETHTEIDVQTGATVSSQQPNLDVRRTEIPAEAARADGDRVLVSGRTFAVRDVQKDGELGAKILLLELPTP